MLLKAILNGKKSAAALLTCGLLLVLVSWAWGRWFNHGREIHPGERREDFLPESNSNQQETPPGPGRRWTFKGRQGQSITLSVESYEFDVYLLLLDAQNRQVAWSDNSGGFFNAQIRTTLPATGRYTVIVCGANSDQFGTYWVSLEEGHQETEWNEAAAESYYRQGIQWCEQKASLRGKSWLNLGMAQYFRERRQWDKAEKYYNESLAAAESQGLVYNQWAVALDRCRMLIRRRKNGLAVSQLQEALKLSKQLKSSREAEARVLIEFGNLYSSTARPDLARVYFRAVEKTAEQPLLPSILVEFYTALNTILQAEEKEKAIAYAEKAYALSEGVDPVLEIKAGQALAGTYLFLKAGKYDEGLALAAEMRARARRLGYLDEEVSATIMMSIGKFVTNNIEEMIHLAGEAIALTDPADENTNPRRIALQLKADGEMLRGNNQAALKACLETLQSVETAWLRESVEELRRELLAQSNSICTQIIRNLYALQAGHPSREYARQAFDYAERSRSRSLLNQLAAAMARRGGVADSQALERDQESLEKLSAVRNQIVMLRASVFPSRDRLYYFQEQRASLIAERMRLQAEIRQSSANSLYAAQLSPLTAEQVQQQIVRNRPNSVVLCYQVGIQDSFLVALTAREVYLFKLPDKKIISKAVDEWRALISEQLGVSRPTPEALYNYSQVAHSLYQMLIQPAAHLIRGRDLIIVPSDALYDLAFESLMVSQPRTPAESVHGHYLIEDHVITYVPSASVWAEIEDRRQQTRPHNSILLVCDTSEGTPKADTPADNWQPARALDQLPGARQEVLNIARLAKQHGMPATVWLGPEANEDKFTHTNLATFRFIHLATHSVADSQDGNTSALTLYNDPTGEKDGILTGDEIAHLRLNTDLLVLSGCETGVGQKAGAEGVVGLSRTFLIAGARCVCVSLWRVDDSWTQKLMSVFYERLLVGRLDKAQALRFAKLKLLKQGASPSQWAAFVLVGSLR